MRVLASFTTGENVKRPLAVRLKIVSHAPSFVERVIPSAPNAAYRTFALPGSKRTSYAVPARVSAHVAPPSCVSQMPVGGDCAATVPVDVLFEPRPRTPARVAIAMWRGSPGSIAVPPIARRLEIAAAPGTGDQCAPSSVVR